MVRMTPLGKVVPGESRGPDEQWGLEMGTEPSGGTRGSSASTFILSLKEGRDCG